MKYAARMLAIAVIMMPLLASAQWQDAHKLVVQVPFEFRAGNKVMPAGEFIVQAADRVGKVLRINNPEADASQYSIVSSNEAQKGTAVNALIFHKYGDRYFLSGIALANSQSIYWLPRDKAETELQAQNGPATKQVLLGAAK
jgi:hypothetical protein